MTFKNYLKEHSFKIGDVIKVSTATGSDDQNAQLVPATITRIDDAKGMVYFKYNNPDAKGVYQEGSATFAAVHK